jgi:hypothetical protein
MIRAVLWDFGGVILSSPFEAFNRYEATNGLPRDFIRSVNATDPDTNAWALLERNDVTARSSTSLFAAESEALGHRIPGADVLGLLSGEIRPEMVAALDARDPRRLPHGVPHQQRGRRRATHGRRRRDGHVRPRRRVEQGRLSASPSRGSTRSRATCSASSRTSACSSTTSASTSSRRERWA